MWWITKDGDLLTNQKSEKIDSPISKPQMKIDERPIVAIQRNPRSGSGRGRGQLLALVRSLRDRNFQVRLFKSRDRLDAWVRQTHIRHRLRCLVAAGGDGTLAEVVNGLPADCAMPIAIVPAGTANVVAHELGLPPSADQLAQLILSMRTRTIATGSINDRRFVFTAGAGFDAQVVASVDPVLKRQTGKLAFVVAAARTLASYRFDRIRVRIDGEESDSAGVIVLNGRCYGGPYVLAPGNDLGNGRFAVLVLRQPGRLSAVSYLAAMAAGRASSWRGIDVFEAVREVEIVSPAGLPVQADGDNAGVIPVSLRAGTGAVRVIC